MAPKGGTKMSTRETPSEKFRKAAVLLQLLINAKWDTRDEIEDEARGQLKAWGINVHEREDEEF
jgi:hypothetical protein